MTAKGEEKHPKNGKKVKLAIIEGNEQMRRMQETVAHRAYAIFESRGSGPWHGLQHWGQAESDPVRPLNCGRTTVGDKLWIGTDARIFEPGTIEIWAAPRKITICGEPRSDEDAQGIGPHSREERIFRVLDLCIDVDPSHLTAKLHGPSLEILVKKAQAKSRQEAQAVAV